MSSFPDFLGFGILTPFRRGPSDFVAGGGEAHVRSMVAQVLGTMAGSDFTEGELPWRGAFGSLLHLLRHQNNRQVLQELGRIYIVEALGRWIPQIRVKGVETSKELGPDQTRERNVLVFRIVYDIIGLRQAGNEVLIPDVDQTIRIAA